MTITLFLDGYIKDQFPCTNVQQCAVSYLLEFPHCDVLAVVCGDNLLHPNSQASDRRSKTSGNGVNASVVRNPSSFVSFNDTNWLWRTGFVAFHNNAGKNFACVLVQNP